jgi:hypothetical protein
MPDASYVDPASSSAWYPSGSTSDPSVYQGSIGVPDLCGGGIVSLKPGGTLSTTVASTAGDRLSLRWHYSANGSAGGWSTTLAVTLG